MSEVERGAERRFMNRLSDYDQRLIAGSRDRLQQFRDGKPLEAIYNAGKNPIYRWGKIGDMVAEKAKSAYEIAKGGGRHWGLYTKWKSKREHEIEKSIASLTDQIQTHQDKIANPSRYIDRPLTQQEHNGLVTRYWPKEIANFEQQINILRGILSERKK